MSIPAELREEQAAPFSGPPTARAHTSSNRPITKISANFIARAMEALDQAAELTGDSRTDVLNRSVQVYAYLCAQMEQGKLVVVEDPATGERERIVFL